MGISLQPQTNVMLNSNLFVTKPHTVEKNHVSVVASAQQPASKKENKSNLLTLSLVAMGIVATAFFCRAMTSKQIKSEARFIQRFLNRSEFSNKLTLRNGLMTDKVGKPYTGLTFDFLEGGAANYKVSRFKDGKLTETRFYRDCANSGPRKVKVVKYNKGNTTTSSVKVQGPSLGRAEKVDSWANRIVKTEFESGIIECDIYKNGKVLSKHLDHKGKQ